MTIGHCWESRNDWLLENDYETYCEVAAEPVGATCMLPDRHEGPHVWTPDNEITIRFTGPAPEEDSR